MPPKHCMRCGAAHGRQGELCEACETAAPKGTWAGHHYTWQGGLELPKAVQQAYTYKPIRWSAWDEEPNRKPRMDDGFDFDRAPDLIEPILAWRGWEVTPTGHLVSSGVQGVWDPGPNKAVCKHAEHTDDVPAVNCACGFYGWHEPADIQHGQIRGAIKCWGEIIVHDVGVRAEFAEILCLFQSTTQAAWLQRASERYGIPLVETQEEAEALAAPQGIRVPEDMRPERPAAEIDDFSPGAYQRQFLNELTKIRKTRSTLRSILGA